MTAAQSLSNHAARAVFLNAHALGHDPAISAGPAAALVERLGFVQLDSIQTIARAHEHILFVRDRKHTQAALARAHSETRDLFEHWTHDAALIPMAYYPHWRWRFASRRARLKENEWWNERLGSRRILGRVLKRIENEGPLRLRDFEEARGGEAWWGWGRAKAALEYLYHTGVLAIARRERFEKVYDLTERVIPEPLRLARPSRAETIDFACRAALQRLGFATPKEMADFFALITADEAASWAHKHRKVLVPVRIEAAGGGKAALAYAAPETALTPQEVFEGLRLLNPFDPAIRNRQRLSRLFGFDYRIEIFVPEAKRRYGYYVYPVLQGDRFTARIDVKTDRSRNGLAVRGLWMEDGAQPDAAFHDGLEQELQRLATFAGVKEIHWDTPMPKVTKRRRAA